MKTLIKQEDMNALEKELYGQNLYNTQPYQLQHPYERGMLISISNYKMYYDEILKNYKKQKFRRVTQLLLINSIFNDLGWYPSIIPMLISDQCFKENDSSRFILLEVE